MSVSDGVSPLPMDASTSFFASSSLASSRFSFARAAKYTVNDGMRTIEKQPTTAASAQRNSVAASTEKTAMLANSSLTVSADMLCSGVLFPLSMISIRRMDGECVYAMAALAFSSASTTSLAKTEPLSGERGHRCECMEFNRTPSSCALVDVACSRVCAENSSSTDFQACRLYLGVHDCRAWPLVTFNTAPLGSVAVMFTHVRFASLAMTCHAHVVVFSSAS